jgi:transcriptional regulator with XRE-family HTH domain
VALGEIVAENLRTVRAGRNLSQEAVARKSGLSVSYISMLGRGERTPPLDTYVVDDLRALKRGGADAPENMQSDAKAKDRWE